MSHTPTSTESATHNHPIPCAACGYNIAGLPPEGLCPECATSIALSLDPRTLWGIPANIIRAMSTSTLLLIIAQAMHIVVFMLSFFALSQGASIIAYLIVITGALCLTGAALTSIAGFLATFRTPFRVREPSSSLRVICLVGSILLAVLTALACSRIVLLLISQPLEDPVLIPIVLIGILAVFATSVATACLIEWTICIAHASASRHQFNQELRPFKTGTRLLLVALPILLGPAGGLFSTLHCYQFLKKFTAISQRPRAY